MEALSTVRGTSSSRIQVDYRDANLKFALIIIIDPEIRKIVLVFPSQEASRASLT